MDPIQWLQEQAKLINPIMMNVSGWVGFGIFVLSMLTLVVGSVYALHRKFFGGDSSAPLAVIIGMWMFFGAASFSDPNSIALARDIVLVYGALWIMNKVGRIYERQTEILEKLEKDEDDEW